MRRRATKNIRLAIYDKEVLNRWGNIDVYEMPLHEMVVLDWDRIEENFNFHSYKTNEKLRPMGDILESFRKWDIDYYMEFKKDQPLFRAPKKVPKLNGTELKIRYAVLWENNLAFSRISILEESEVEQKVELGYPPTWVSSEANTVDFRFNKKLTVEEAEKKIEDYLRGNGQELDGVLLITHEYVDLLGNKHLHKFIRNKNVKTAFDSYGRMYGGYSTHSLPTRNAERLSEAQKERNVPKYVKEKAEYFEEEKGYEPSYAWAMAWSIWCKYKNPDSPHCKRDQKANYLINQGVRGSKKKPYPKKAFLSKLFPKMPQGVGKTERIWFKGSQEAGLPIRYVSKALGMGDDTHKEVTHKGHKIMVVVGMSRYAESDKYQDPISDTYTFISVQGLDKEAPTGLLKELLESYAKKMNLGKREYLTKKPKGRAY